MDGVSLVIESPSEASGSPHRSHALAADYFAFLAQSFPVMCASDEFHFLPRAEKAADRLHELEDLDGEKLESVCDGLHSYRRAFARALEEAPDLEAGIDLELLQSSSAGLLIELEQAPVWRTNPLLYLKILFIGLDQALSRPWAKESDREERTISRLRGSRALLDRARENLSSVPTSQHSAALLMIRDGTTFLQSLPRRLPASLTHRLQAELSLLLERLEAFDAHLRSKAPVPDRSLAATTLEATLRERFRSSWELSDISELAAQEHRRSLEELAVWASRIDSGGSWQAIYSAGSERDRAADPTELYAEELRSLQRFFAGSVFEVSQSAHPLRLAPVPSYLRSVRSAASYAAALRSGETSSFFLSPQEVRGDTPSAGKAEPAPQHQDVRFLTAHETIPGHHLIDARRRGLANPVRRQIESPLFYEGFATYAEGLLCETGYADAPWDRLVEQRRRLWRACRCRLEIEMYRGRMTRKQGAELLAEAGVPSGHALAQVDRYRLAPGYQLCYTLGSYELRQLSASFLSRLGWNRFHHAVLASGQIPFSLLRRTLSELCADNGAGRPTENQ